MLRRLRWQLTLVYLLAGLGLAALVGAGSYSLLRNTFNRTTDLALQYRMASLFDSYGLPLPDELSSARNRWLQTYAVGIPAGSNEASPVTQRPEEEDSHEDESEDDKDHGKNPGEAHEEEQYDARLAALFVFPLDANGELLSNPISGQPLVSPDPSAAAATFSKGFDWRTNELQNGVHVRLLTYQTGSLTGPAFIQVGRLLSDQDRALSQFLVSLVFLGGASILLLGVLSWWLSGRSLSPAQKAWDQQQVFVANASHELRTPLTLIRASAEYGLMSDPDPETRPLLEDIQKECDYMNRLVEDLLLLSRLDTRRLNLARERIEVDDLVQETCTQMQKLAVEKGIDLRMDGAEGVIQGDRVRIRQVLLILLDNAFRFTAPGSIVMLGAWIQKKRVIIQVSDRGQGISPEHIPHVFDRFYQAGSPTRDGDRSNGLGLSIAKALVQAQGGSIHLESQVGQGTQVKLDFPAVE